VENLKSVAPNEPASDAKVMKARTVLKWSRSANEKGRFAVICNFQTGGLGRSLSDLDREVLALCGTRYSQRGLCEDVTRLIQTLDLPFLVDGVNEGFDTGAFCKTG
jgi:hypothetical protein